MIFQTMNSVETNNPSLKYLRFTLLSCKDIGIGKFEFVAKTQFLLNDKIVTKKSALAKYIYIYIYAYLCLK